MILYFVFYNSLGSSKINPVTLSRTTIVTAKPLYEKTSKSN